METTILVVAGKKLKVPRVLKRTLQVAVSVGLTLLVVLVIQVGDGLLAGRANSFQTATAAWLGFVRRPDMLAIMTLTALVTVLFVYWQRDRERK
jgi:Mg/Co/Ni transporter MgtE